MARSRRAPAALLACALAAANVGVCLETFDLIERTGGRGAWSDTVTRYVRGLGGDRLVVSLDWGFHEQVLFLGNAPAVEPFWAIPWFVEHEGAWVLDGGPENLYLTYDWRYGTFVYGALFLDAVRKLPLGVAVVEPHLDRAGEVAFASVVIPRPHRLVFRERFEIELR